MTSNADEIVRMLNIFFPQFDQDMSEIICEVLTNGINETALGYTDIEANKVYKHLEKNGLVDYILYWILADDNRFPVLHGKLFCPQLDMWSLKKDYYNSYILKMLDVKESN